MFFQYKKTIEVKPGTPVPADARYLKSERKVVRERVENLDSGNPMSYPETCYQYAMFHTYEIPCDKDGNTEVIKL